MPNAKLELYRIFQTVADEGSVSGAAKALYISQSAVSQSLRQLEDQLQIRLFVRSHRGVALTNEGSLLYDYVRSAMGLIRAGEEKISQTLELKTGELVIGASDTVTRFVLLPYLQPFHSAYPSVALKVLNATSFEVLKMLQNGQVDIAFASTPEDSSALTLRHCLDTHNIFVASRDYGCDFSRSYSVAEISAFPLLLLERKSSARRFLEKFFMANGAVLRPEIELCSHELLVDLAEIGLGVACVTREFAHAALENGTLREIKTSPQIPGRSLSVCAMKNVALSPAAAEFIKFWD
jgi:DNA-binding transcriptional LysR family regulator